MTCTTPQTPLDNILLKNLVKCLPKKPIFWAKNPQKNFKAKVQPLIEDEKILERPLVKIQPTR